MECFLGWIQEKTKKNYPQKIQSPYKIENILNVRIGKHFLSDVVW